MKARPYLIIISLIALSASFASGESIANPQYASWAKHKVGTKVVMHTARVMPGGRENSTETTQTLLQISRDKVVVQEMTVTSTGGAPRTEKRSVDIMAKVEQGQEGAPPGPPNMKFTSEPVGKETITIAGKSYECTISEFTIDQGSAHSTGKSWMTPLIPGAFAKLEVSAPPPVTSTASTIVTEMDIK